MPPFASDVFYRAFGATLDDLGESPTSILVYLVAIPLLTWGINRVRHGGPRAILTMPSGWQQRIQAAAVAIVVLLLVCIVPFTKNLWTGAQERDATLAAELDIMRRQRDTLTAEKKRSDEASAQSVAMLRDIGDRNRESSELRSQVVTLTAALGSAHSQIVDLQQELASARQPPTIVLGSGATPTRESCDTLGRLVDQGQTILLEVRKQRAPPPAVKAQGWADQVEAFLTKTLGPGSVGLFRNSSGLPMRVTSLDSQPHRSLEGNLQTRLARLQQFAGEVLLGDLIDRPTFHRDGSNRTPIACALASARSILARWPCFSSK